MFYPLLMRYFHPLLNSMTNSQKEELRKNSDKFIEGIENHFKNIINEEPLNDDLLEQIFDYQNEFNLDSTYFLINPDDRAKALSEIYIHYVKNRVEPNKELGICLFEISLAGTQFVSNIEDLATSLENGEKLNLIWEKNNPYDKNAIKVLFEDKKLGYIPRFKNEDLVFLFEQEYELFAILKRVIWNSDQLKIKVLVYLNK